MVKEKIERPISLRLCASEVMELYHALDLWEMTTRHGLTKRGIKTTGHADVKRAHNLRERVWRSLPRKPAVTA